MVIEATHKIFISKKYNQLNKVSHSNTETPDLIQTDEQNMSHNHVDQSLH